MSFLFHSVSFGLSFPRFVPSIAGLRGVSANQHVSLTLQEMPTHGISCPTLRGYDRLSTELTDRLIPECDVVLKLVNSCTIFSVGKVKCNASDNAKSLTLSQDIILTTLCVFGGLRI